MYGVKSIFAVSLALFLLVAASFGAAGYGNVSDTQDDSVVLEPNETTDFYMDDDEQLSSVENVSIEVELEHNNTTTMIKAGTIQVRANDSGNYYAAETVNDSAFLNENASEGDTIRTTLINEDTGTAVYNSTFTVGTITDEVTILKPNTTEYNESVTFAEVPDKNIPFTDYAVPFFSETFNSVSINEEIIFDSEDMDADNRSAVVALDADSQAALDEAVPEDASAGDTMDTTASVNGEQVPLYFNEAGENADEYNNTLVYDQNSGRVLYDTNSSMQSAQVNIDTSEEYGFFDAYQLPDVSITDTLVDF